MKVVSRVARAGWPSRNHHPQMRLRFMATLFPTCAHMVQMRPQAGKSSVRCGRQDGGQTGGHGAQAVGGDPGLDPVGRAGFRVRAHRPHQIGRRQYPCAEVIARAAACGCSIRRRATCFVPCKRKRLSQPMLRDTMVKRWNALIRRRYGPVAGDGDAPAGSAAACRNAVAHRHRRRPRS